MLAEPDISSDPPDLTGIAIRGAATRVLGYGVGVLISLGSATILLRHLGVVTFGRYITVTSLVGLVSGVTEAGIFVYGIREFRERDDTGRRDLLANLLGMRLAITAVGIGIAIAFGAAIGYRGVIVLGTLIAGTGLLAQVTVDILSIPLQVKLQLGRLTLVDLVRRLLALALIATLALLGAGMLPLLGASAAATAAALALLASFVRSSVPVHLSFERAMWRALFIDSLPFAIVMSIAAIYLYVTVIVMSLAASAYQTGLFGTSFRITQVALAIPSLLLTAVFPLMLGTKGAASGEGGGSVGKVFNVSLICGVWMSLAMALGASFVITVIAGSRAPGAVPVLRIQAAILAANFISTSSGLALLSQRRYRALMISSAVVLAINIGVALVLVREHGATGGATADLVSEVLLAVCFTTVLVRSSAVSEIKPSIALPVLLAALLSGAVLLAPVGAVPHVILATGIYFGVLILTRSIPAEVYSAAKRTRASKS